MSLILSFSFPKEVPESKLHYFTLNPITTYNQLQTDDNYPEPQEDKICWERRHCFLKLLSVVLGVTVSLWESVKK